MFDPHIHMTSRTTDDYQNMKEAGIKVVIEPSFWMGSPRHHVGTFEDYFNSLIGWEHFRARQFGIHHFCTIALNPKEANDPILAREVMQLIPLYLSKKTVVAVGEIGLDDQTKQEEIIFQEHIQLAKVYQLPILIHTPHRDKKRGTQRCLDIVKEGGIHPELVLIDHNTEETIKGVRDRGHWAGHSIYPHTKMDDARMVKIVKEFGTEKIIINSAADWGVSDPLMVPKTAKLMEKEGIPLEEVNQIVFENPLSFFSASQKFTRDDLLIPPRIDQSELYSGNSVLRGQVPIQEGLYENRLH